MLCARFLVAILGLGAGQGPRDRSLPLSLSAASPRPDRVAPSRLAPGPGDPTRGGAGDLFRRAF
jgi:hypothetical protein